jgi:hypothetical protein
MRDELLVMMGKAPLCICKHVCQYGASVGVYNQAKYVPEAAKP